MRGLVAAATIIGCLKYGACFSGLDAQGQPVLQLRLKDEDLLEAPDDSAFLQSLRISSSRANNGLYSPLALVEAFTKATPYCGEPEKASEACDLGKQTAVQKNWWMTVLPNAGIHFPYLRAVPIPTSCDMSLGMQWMALICRAIFSGLLRTEDHSFLLSWCMERRLGSTGQMWLHCPIWNWTHFWCLLYWPTTTLANSSKSGVGYSYLPYCRGYSYQPGGGKQIHAHPKTNIGQSRREKRGGKWVRCWKWMVRRFWPSWRPRRWRESLATMHRRELTRISSLASQVAIVETGEQVDRLLEGYCFQILATNRDWMHTVEK